MGTALTLYHTHHHCGVKHPRPPTHCPAGAMIRALHQQNKQTNNQHQGSLELLDPFTQALAGHMTVKNQCFGQLQVILLIKMGYNRTMGH